MKPYPAPQTAPQTAPQAAPQLAPQAAPHPAPHSAPQPGRIDYDAPFTVNLLQALSGAARAQPNETEAEFNTRYAAVVTAFAAFAPRDPLEQMLAAQAVAAHHAALECMTLAMLTEDLAEQGRLRGRFATLNRSMRDTMRTLTKMQERPANSLPPIAERQARRPAPASGDRGATGESPHTT